MVAITNVRASIPWSQKPTMVLKKRYGIFRCFVKNGRNQFVFRFLDRITSQFVHNYQQQRDGVFILLMGLAITNSSSDSGVTTNVFFPYVSTTPSTEAIAIFCSEPMLTASHIVFICIKRPIWPLQFSQSGRPWSEKITLCSHVSRKRYGIIRFLVMVVITSWYSDSLVTHTFSLFTCTKEAVLVLDVLLIRNEANQFQFWLRCDREHEFVHPYQRSQQNASKLSIKVHITKLYSESSSQQSADCSYVSKRSQPHSKAQIVHMYQKGNTPSSMSSMGVTITNSSCDYRVTTRRITFHMYRHKHVSTSKHVMKVAITN